MKLFLAYLRLIRPFNLIMIVFTLYMVRAFFNLRGDNYVLNVGRMAYALFSLSFILVAAAGYIINDYYDVKIDKVNKPKKVIIGTIISARQALITYWILNILAIITGFISCSCTGIPLLGVLFLFYWVGLWFYSFKLKSTFLTGNILIGIFLALVPLGAAAIELWASTKNSSFTYSDNELILVWRIIGCIALFAFLSNVIREIIKDTEDIEGDKLNGCRTMPIVIGIRKTKWIVFVLLLFLNVALAFPYFEGIHNLIFLFIYFLAFIQTLFFLIYYWLLKPSSPTDFHKISIGLKVLMLTGIIYVFAYAFLIFAFYHIFD